MGEATKISVRPEAIAAGKDLYLAKFFQSMLRRFRTSEWRIRGDNLPILTRNGTRHQLAHVLADLGLNKGVEVGTRYGAYAMVMLNANPSLHLYCVDPWTQYSSVRQDKQDKIYDQAVGNLEPYGKRVRIIKEPSMVALNRFRSRSLDFVYIDGDHRFDYVMPDIIYWTHKVKRGGVIMVHDYVAGHGFGVMSAVNAYTQAHNVRPWFVTRERLPTAFWLKSYYNVDNFRR